MQPAISRDAPRSELDRLTSEHRALKTRLHELSRRSALTSAERVERAQLERRRHRTKAQILRLREH